MRQLTLLKLLSGLLVLSILIGVFISQSTRESATRVEKTVTEVSEDRKLVKLNLIDVDTDQDALLDWEEGLWHTNPNLADTDGDGTTDGEETRSNRNPLKPGPDDSLVTKKIESETVPTPRLTTSLPEKLKSQAITMTIPPIRAFDTYPLIARQDFTIDPNGLSSYGDFYNAYAKITTEVSFPLDTMEEMNKVEDSEGKGRVLTLEELMALVNKGDSTKRVRTSLLAWADLDKRMAEALKTLPIKSTVVDANQELASWFTYHGQIAERFADPSIELSEKQSLADEYARYGKIHNTSFGQKIARAQKREPLAFTLAKKAEAFTCASFVPPGIYNFGGRVAYYLPCNWGIVETIAIPCGGIFLFTYAGMAANPFLFQYGPYIISDAILGRSVVAPGICVLGVPPVAAYFPYEAIVLFYGAAMI